MRGRGRSFAAPSTRAALRVALRRRASIEYAPVAEDIEVAPWFRHGMPSRDLPRRFTESAEAAYASMATPPGAGDARRAQEVRALVYDSRNGSAPPFIEMPIDK